MHWTEKQTAKAYFAGVVQRHGWTLLGYSADQSNMMYDHWAPASWSGIATKEKAGKVFILNVSAYKPKVGDKSVLDNPGKASWHVESDGIILDSGVGVFQDGYNAHHRNADAARKIERLADRIDSATTERKVVTVKPSEGPINLVPNGKFTVRAGTKLGYVEILFGSKPDESIRNSLKSAGYRWSPANSVWYGKETNLPGLFRSAPEQKPTTEKLTNLFDGNEEENANWIRETFDETPAHLA
jgi:hypothetical protein